jgi:hypothetical protein
MHLTDDDEHLVTAGRAQSLKVRIRVWRRRGAVAVVLVESAEPGRAVRPWAGRVAALVHVDVFKGQDTPFVYLEREWPLGLERFYRVTFALHRLAYAVRPWRDLAIRSDVEHQVGEKFA